MQINLTRVFSILIAPITVFIFIIFLVNSTFYLQHQSQLISLVTLDLVLTVPLVYYLSIRKNNDIPNITVVSVFILSVIAAHYVLPVEQQGLLKQIKIYAIPLIEVTILGVVLFSVRRVLINARSIGQKDFYKAILSSCRSIIPNKFGDLLATELAVIYYGVFPLKKVVKGTYEFTHFEKSGIRTTILAFLGLAIMETVVVHIVMHPHYPLLTWILTFLSLYTCLQIVSLMRSLPIRLSKVILDSKKLELNFGFFSTCTIDIDNIERLEFNKRALQTETEVVQFSPLGPLDSHNVIIHLYKEERVHRIYGVNKSFKKLAVFLDDIEGLAEIIENVKKERI